MMKLPRLPKRIAWSRRHSTLLTIELVVAVLTCGAAGAAATASRSRAPAPARVSVAMSRHSCLLSRRRVVVGAVTFRLLNRGRQARIFSIGGKRSRVIAPRGRGFLRTSLLRTGRFPYRCWVSERRSAGHGSLLVVRPPGSPPRSRALWSADMEERTLADWYEPSRVESLSHEHGGGEYNSRGGNSYASDEVAHSGRVSAKQVISTSGGSSGTRLFRWKEYRSLRVGQGLSCSAWIYLPRPVSVAGYFNIFQFKSKTQDGAYVDVFFQLNIFSRADGTMYLRPGWGWGAENAAFPRGPHATDGYGGKWYEPVNRIDVPVGRWFHVEAYTLPSAAYAGRTTFWQDGRLIYDFRNVKTGYANTDSENGVDTQWSVNAYANGLLPRSYVQYVDDVAVFRDP